MSRFNPRDPKTWGPLLSLSEVAAIYQRTPEAIRHALKPNRARVAGIPKPHLTHPMRWRAADVIRDLRVRDLVEATS